jgi:exopolysaccharide biosynthesis polyprenyl glycosylphosphotransferase
VNDKSIERAVLLQDLSIVLGSLWLSHLAREAVATHWSLLKPAVPATEYVHLLLVFVPTWGWCAERVHLQRVRTLTRPLIDLVRALLFAQGWGAVALALILTGAQAPLNRSFIGIYLVVSTSLLLVAKLLQRQWVQRTRGEMLALVLGPPGVAAPPELQSVRGRQVEVLETTDPEALRTRLAAGGVDEVVLAGEIDRGDLRRLLEACSEAGLPALVRLDRVDLDVARPVAALIGPALYVAYQEWEPARPSLLLKAIFDRLAALALLPLCLPILGLLAVVVRATSPGPALFVQRRGGLNGRPFPMLKFRTMRVGAEAEREALLAANEMDGPVFKIAADPRVTRIGRWLRRTSLDELPQLLNVLVGHMSLVGPRPLPLLETQALRGKYRRRLTMRPGVTCLWQISGRNELGFEQWMNLDLQYVDQWSLGLDLAILLRTLPALLTARGAR